MEAIIKQEICISSNTIGYRLCPVCRRVMAPVDSNQENGFSFIWYECRDASCDGQWLEKTALCGKEA